MYEGFFNLSVDMLCVAGYDGFFKHLNPAWTQTLGFTDAELMARPFLDFVHPDDRVATIAVVEDLARGATIIHFRNRYECRDGTYRWLDWTAIPAVSAGPAPAGKANNQEAILGFNPESTPLIVTALVASIGVVGAVLFYWRRVAVLWATGAVMSAFAVLDILEIAHQVAESHATLVILAGTVSLLHVAAALMAIRVATARPSVEQATAC